MFPIYYEKTKDFGRVRLPDLLPQPHMAFGNAYGRYAFLCFSPFQG